MKINFHQNILLAIFASFSWSGCAINKPLVKGWIESDPKIYVVIQNCGPVQYFPKTATTSMALGGGLIAGLIDSAVNSIAYSGKTKEFNEKIGDWSFCDEFSTKLVSDMRNQLNWNNVALHQSKNSTEAKEYDDFIRYLRTGLTFPTDINFSDRNDEEKEKLKRRTELDLKRSQLKANDFDYLLAINFSQLYFSDNFGTGEYCVKATGTLYNIEKAGQDLSKCTVDAAKNPSNTERRVQFRREMELDTETVRNKFRIRGHYLIREFISNLKS